jgi:hypothetical protein
MLLVKTVHEKVGTIIPITVGGSTHKPKSSRGHCGTLKMDSAPCQKCRMLRKFHVLFFLGPQLEYVSQPPVQSGVVM